MHYLTGRRGPFNRDVRHEFKSRSRPGSSRRVGISLSNGDSRYRKHPEEQRVTGTLCASTNSLTADKHIDYDRGARSTISRRMGPGCIINGRDNSSIETRVAKGAQRRSVISSRNRGMILQLTWTTRASVLRGLR